MLLFAPSPPKKDASRSPVPSRRASRPRGVPSYAANWPAIRYSPLGVRVMANTEPLALGLVQKLRSCGVGSWPEASNPDPPVHNTASTATNVAQKGRLLWVLRAIDLAGQLT